MDNWNERFGTYLVSADNTLGEHGVSGKYIWEIDREIIDNRLTLGIDYRNITYRQKMYNAPAWGLEANVGYRDVKREAVAYFFYNELTLADRLVVSVGYRGEITNQDWADRSYNVFDWGSGSYVDTYLVGSEKYRNEAYTAGLTLLYGDDNKAYFRFSTGYRIPVIDEQVQYNGFNPLVRPERSVTYELGVKHFLTPEISVALDLYYARYTDEIYVNPFTLENISFERTVHRGVELSVNAHPLDWLTLSLGWAYQDAFFYYSPYSGKTLPLIPKNSVTFGASVDWRGISASLNGRWTDGRIRDGDFYNAHPMLAGYFTMDLRAGYTFTLWEKLETEVFAGVNNVTDARYADFGSFRVGNPNGYLYEYPLAGRTFYGGVTVRF